MNKWKVAFLVMITVLIVSNGYWFMQVVDSAISYSYLSDSYNEETDRFKALGKLVVAGSTEYTQADILHLLRQSQPDANIFEDGNKIVFNHLEFAFVDGKLKEVL